MSLRWFKRLLPREDRFFDLFEAHAGLVVQAAQALERLLAGEDFAERAAGIVRLEAEADAITAEVMLAVRLSFITPFDRGDIRDLIQAMDDAIDMMKKTVKTARLFGVTAFTPRMQEMGTVIVAAARLLAEAVPLLARLDRNVTRLTALCEQVTQLEDRADELHQEGLRELFHSSGHSDPMRYIVLSQLYDRLEKIADSIENAADEIGGIVVENV